MCLIVFAWHAHPEYPLIVAANRDEFHARPTANAHWWQDHPDILAGRDLQAGGTWLGVTRDGRFSTITNYREQSVTGANFHSRGELVTEFMSGSRSPVQYSREIDGADYAGFNLLTADHRSMCYVSNRGDAATELPPGVYGLSNASLDTPWSKLTRTRHRLTELVHADNVSESTLLQTLSDRETATEDAASEHPSLERARAITAPFIVTEDYGTRCSTVMLWHASGKKEFVEQRFGPSGKVTGISRYSF